MNIQGGSFSNMQQISQNVARIENGKRASNSQTIRHLETVDAKETEAKTDVINSAMELKATANNAKGNFVNVMA